MKAIPGILKAHYIMCEKEGHLRLFVDNAKDNVVANINYFDCESEMDVDDQDDVEAGDVDDEDGIEEVVVGDWVVVNYDAKMYPGKVTKVVEGSMKVNVMKACFTYIFIL